MSARFTIVLIVLLALVGGLVAVTQVLRTDEDAPDRGERLYRIASSEIAMVTITQGEESVEFVKEESDWFIVEEDDENTQVDISRWGGVTTLLGGPSVVTNLTEQEEELGTKDSYGLDPPRTVIQVDTFSGQGVEINIGDITPTEDGYYIYVTAPEEILYIVHSSWVDVLERLISEPPYPPEV